ncbi:MAG: hypothetical protein ACRD2W_24845 [Acidimicrobiales bacterium]
MVFVLAASCTFAGGSNGRALPPLPTVMDVTMSEYRYDHPPQAVAGRIVFRVHNAGKEEHELILVAIPEEVTSLEEQLRSESRVGVETIVTLRRRAPASSGTFAADLGPGRYGFICFIVGADDVSHALKGMSSEFRVP